MPKLTLRNIPGDVFKRLKSRAERHKRSLNSEILGCLESSVESKKADVSELIKKAQFIRKSINYIIPLDEITKQKQSGRL